MSAKRSEIDTYGPHVAPPQDTDPTVRRAFEIAMTLIRRLGRPPIDDLSVVMVLCTADGPNVDLPPSATASVSAYTTIRCPGFEFRLLDMQRVLAHLRARGEPDIVAAIQRCSGRNVLAVLAMDRKDKFYLAPCIFTLLSPGGQA